MCASAVEGKFSLSFSGAVISSTRPFDAAAPRVYNYEPGLIAPRGVTPTRARVRELKV